MDSHHEITAQGNGLEVAANCSDLVNSMPPCMGAGVWWGKWESWGSVRKTKN